MTTLLAASCLGFHMDCGTLLKGGLGVAMGFVLFIGSVLLLLSAVLGRKMGDLVLAGAVFGWRGSFSPVWVFGVWSQGPQTPGDLGPRGGAARSFSGSGLVPIRPESPAPVCGRVGAHVGLHLVEGHGPQ